MVIQTMKDTGINRLLTVLLMAVLMTASVTLAGCSRDSGAVSAAREALESMRMIEQDQNIRSQLDELLDDEGREYYEQFLKKAEDFEYEITGSDESESSATVHVRVVTYDFGSEYLKSWSDFLEESEAAGSAEYDSAELYKTLFRNLAGLEKKEYIGYADINCTCGEDGVWTTDAETNTSLRDAVLGGMVSEMSSLAGLQTEKTQ